MSNSGEEVSGYDTNNRTTEWDRAALIERYNPRSQDLDGTLQSWVLERADMSKKKKYVDFGCIVCSHKALKWSLGSIFLAFCVIGLPIIITKSLPKHHSPPAPPDNYTLAIHKALLFFNAQKCMFYIPSSPILYIHIRIILSHIYGIFLFSLHHISYFTFYLNFIKKIRCVHNVKQFCIQS